MREKLLELAEQGTPEEKAKVIHFVNTQFPVGGEQEEVVFKLEDFAKGKKPITAQSPPVVAKEVEKEMGNTYKKMMEMTDEEVRAKFNDDISLAGQYLSDEIANLGEAEYKAPSKFTKGFFDTFRATMEKRMNAEILVA